MKKLIFLLVFTLILFNGFSQSVYIKTGLNLSNCFMFDQIQRSDKKTKLGFHLGGTFEIPIDTNIFFETGLFLDSKGYKSKLNILADPNAEFKTALYYIEVPILLKYKYPYKKWVFTGAFGPNFGFGCWGYQSLTGSRYYPDNTQYFNFGKSSNYNWFNGALFGSLGIEYSKFIFTVNCNFGLTNIFAYQYAVYVSNYSLSFTAGYKLWTKKN